MSCPNFTERIARCAGGDLPAAEAAAVERHLRDCPACARLARALADDRRDLQRLPPVAPDSAALAARRAAVLAQLSADARTTRRGWDRRMLAVAALVVAALGLVAIWSLRQSGAPGAARSDSGRLAEAPAPGGEGESLPADSDPEVARPAAQTEPTGGDADRTEPHRNKPPATVPVRRTQATPTDPTLTGAPAAPTSPIPPEPPPPATPELAAEPMLIQLVSDDPDLVIYWLVDPEENPDENTAATAD